VSSVVFNLFFYQDYAPNRVIATKASRRKRFGFEENQGYTYVSTVVFNLFFYQDYAPDGAIVSV